MKIIHLCLSNNVNAGDIALRHAAQDQLRKLWPQAQIAVADIDAVRWDKESIEYLNNNADLLVIGPGGIFLKPGHKETRSGWLWDVDLELLSLLRLPVFAYSIGYNVFRKDKPDNVFVETMNKFIEKTSLCTLRHGGGIKEISNYLEADNKVKIEQLYCPTILYRWDKGDVLKKKTGKRVGILCAADRLEQRHKDLDAYLNQIVSTVEYLKANGYEVIYLSHISGDEWVLNYYNKFDDVLRLCDYSMDEIYDVYDNLDFVVADRGHAQMIGYARGAIVITPSSHDKLDWFYEDIGLSNYSIAECDPDLAKKIIYLIENTKRDAWNRKYIIEMRKIIRNHKNKLNKLKKIVEEWGCFE